MAIDRVAAELSEPGKRPDVALSDRQPIDRRPGVTPADECLDRDQST